MIKLTYAIYSRENISIVIKFTFNLNLKKISINLIHDFCFHSGSPIPDNPVRGNIDPAIDGKTLSPPVPASTAWHSQRRMILVRSNKGMNVCHWPIPESFWPDSSTSRLVNLND